MNSWWNSMNWSVTWQQMKIFAMVKTKPALLTVRVAVVNKKYVNIILFNWLPSKIIWELRVLWSDTFVEVESTFRVQKTWCHWFHHCRARDVILSLQTVSTYTNRIRIRHKCRLTFLSTQKWRWFCVECLSTSATVHHGVVGARPQFTAWWTFSTQKSVCWHRVVKRHSRRRFEPHSFPVVTVTL